MTTIETLQASYHAASQALHHATINDDPDNAFLWCGVLRNTAQQLKEFGRPPPNLDNSHDG